MLGTAISLLLAFKLSQSYDRWWEARKIWGAIVNDSRSLMIQVKNFIAESPEKNDYINKIVMRQIAFCYALGDRLRENDPLEKSRDYLILEDEKEIRYQHHLPLFLLELHQKDIAELRKKILINDFQEVRLNETVTRLVDSMGMAERIKNTVFPPPYRVFHDFFIYLFLITLSFSITELKGVWQILISTVVSVPFFLLERTGFMLQDPFENRTTDISVTAIADTVSQDLLSGLPENQVQFKPKSKILKNFYIN